MQTTFTPQLTGIEQKVATEKFEIDSKLSKLQAIITNPMPFRFPSAGVDVAAATGYEVSSPTATAANLSARSRPVSPPPAAFRRSDIDHKVLVIGFLRAIPKAGLNKHFDKIMNKFTADFEDYSSGVFCVSSGTMCSIGFSVARDIGIFLKRFRADRRLARRQDLRIATLPGKDTDDVSHFTDIVFKAPSFPEDRARGRRLSPNHQLLSPRFLPNAVLRANETRQGNREHGVRGRFMGNRPHQP
jgi:hypothetical protein